MSFSQQLLEKINQFKSLQKKNQISFDSPLKLRQDHIKRELSNMLVYQEKQNKSQVQYSEKQNEINQRIENFKIDLIQSQQKYQLQNQAIKIPEQSIRHQRSPYQLQNQSVSKDKNKINFTDSFNIINSNQKIAQQQQERIVSIQEQLSQQKKQLTELKSSRSKQKEKQLYENNEFSIPLQQFAQNEQIQSPNKIVETSIVDSSPLHEMLEHMQHAQKKLQQSPAHQKQREYFDQISFSDNQMDLSQQINEKQQQQQQSQQLQQSSAQLKSEKIQDKFQEIQQSIEQSILLLKQDVIKKIELKLKEREQLNSDQNIGIFQNENQNKQLEQYQILDEIHEEQSDSINDREYEHIQISGGKKHLQQQQRNKSNLKQDQNFDNKSSPKSPNRNADLSISQSYSPSNSPCKYQNQGQKNAYQQLLQGSRHKRKTSGQKNSPNKSSQQLLKNNSEQIKQNIISSIIPQLGMNDGCNFDDSCDEEEDLQNSSQQDVNMQAITELSQTFNKFLKDVSPHILKNCILIETLARKIIYRPYVVKKYYQTIKKEMNYLQGYVQNYDSNKKIFNQHVEEFTSYILQSVQTAIDFLFGRIISNIIVEQLENSNPEEIKQQLLVDIFYSIQKKFFKRELVIQHRKILRKNLRKSPSAQVEQPKWLTAVIKYHVNELLQSIQWSLFRKFPGKKIDNIWNQEYIFKQTDLLQLLQQIYINQQLPKRLEVKDIINITIFVQAQSLQNQFDEMKIVHERPILNLQCRTQNYHQNIFDAFAENLVQHRNSWRCSFIQPQHKHTWYSTWGKLEQGKAKENGITIIRCSLVNSFQKNGHKGEIFEEVFDLDGWNQQNPNYFIFLIKSIQKGISDGEFILIIREICKYGIDIDQRKHSTLTNKYLKSCSRLDKAILLRLLEFLFIILSNMNPSHIIELPMFFDMVLIGTKKIESIVQDLSSFIPEIYCRKFGKILYQNVNKISPKIHSLGGNDLEDYEFQQKIIQEINESQYKQNAKEYFERKSKIISEWGQRQGISNLHHKNTITYHEELRELINKAIQAKWF